jgi:hypothetical protein
MLFPWLNLSIFGVKLSKMNQRFFQAAPCGKRNSHGPRFLDFSEKTKYLCLISDKGYEAGKGFADGEKRRQRHLIKRP